MIEFNGIYWVKQTSVTDLMAELLLVNYFKILVIIIVINLNGTFYTLYSIITSLDAFEISSI